MNSSLHTKTIMTCCYDNDSSDSNVENTLVNCNPGENIITQR